MPGRALSFAILIAAVLLLVGCSQLASALDGPTPLKAGQYGDKRLYRDITAEVRAGTPYYRAAAQLHRGHGYPLKPGIAVRLPTLTWAAANVGWQAMRAAAFALLAGVALAWFYALRGRATIPERFGVAAVVLASAGMLTGDPMIIHERWAGLFLALALALRIGWREAWPASLAAVAAALAVRELALPFALLALACAVWERRWREALGWSALVGLFGAVLALHLQLVAAEVRPGDLTSQGWGAFGGLPAALSAIVNTSPLQYLLAVPATVLAILPLLGWFGLARRERLFCLALFAGYGLMFALFARPDNFYWGAIVQPAWFIGLAFLPRAAVRLARKLRRNSPLSYTGPI